MASLMPNGKQQFFTASGKPLNGGKLYTYAAGTSTLKLTFSDAAGAVPNTNPIILDPRGEAVVYWSGAYKIVLQDSLSGSIYTVDNYATDQAVTLLATAQGAGLIGNTPTGNITSATVQAALNELDTKKATKLSPTLTTPILNMATLTAPTVDSLNGGQLAGMRNLIINGRFQINQRAVTGSVVLAAGAYGHDRFKAGSAGCTYTFATVAGLTTIAISAGSLVQSIEDANVTQASYVMSWTGTAQGRIVGGTYAAAPVQINATAGTQLNVEFGVGTLTKAQVEPGTALTPFENRFYGLELMLCQRYYESVFATIGTINDPGYYFFYRAKKRVEPTVTFSSVITGASALASGLDGWNGFCTSGRQGITLFASAEL